MLSPRCQALKDHYESAFEGKAEPVSFFSGPVDELPEDFCVFEIGPSAKRETWIYASCGMSFSKCEAIEIFLMSPRQAGELVEIIYALSHYHINCEELGPAHTVNFGVPWLEGSSCDHGLLSKPEAAQEWAEVESKRVQCLWLIPITKQERDYKKEYGVEALDSKFSEKKVDCRDPLRKSAV